MNCPKCGKPVSPNAAFCRYCGMRMGVQTAPAGKICPTCGTMLSAQAKFCSKCGTRMDELPKPLICAACGAQLPPGSLFCNKCGGRVDQTPKTSVCRGCGAQLAPDFLFCNLCGTPCAGASGAAQKDEKTEPVPSSAPELLPNTEPATMPEPEILSANDISLPEPVLVLSSEPIIEPEEKPIIESETESFVMTTPEPVSETIADIEAVSVELTDAEESEKEITANHCPTCGKERIPGMAFCINCEARLPQAEPAAVSVPEPVPEIELKPEPDISATPMQGLAFEEVPVPASSPVADTCPTCGKERIAGMAFCINCGARLPQAEPAAVSAPEPVQDIEPKPEPDISATPMQGLAFEEVPVPAPSPVAGTCPTCGKERIPGMAFCTGCGARLTAPQTEPAEVSAPEPVAEIEPVPEPDIAATPIQELAFEEVPVSAPVPAGNVCPTCGKERTPGMAFCTGCGARLSQPEPAAASVPVISPVDSPVMPPVDLSAKSFVIERIQMPEQETEQPAPAWQSVCAACGMVVASGLRNCPRCGAKV